MAKAVLGIIGGSGLYELPGLENRRQAPMATPWGEPSGDLSYGEIGGLPIVFLPRHGQGISGPRRPSITAPISTR